MPHVILTKDSFLKTALSELLLEVPDSRKVCVVDIESYRSLGVIYRRLIRKNLPLSHRLIFIGGKDVNSRILEPLVTVYRKSCLKAFRWQLIHGRTNRPEYAVNHIARCRSLCMLTAQEKRTLFALLDTGDTNAAARQIYLSPKTVYTYTRNIGMKLNLSSILQVRQFIFSEFTVDTETGDIAAH
jgi:DNA-binding NarL/FixJ family response regulator